MNQEKNIINKSIEEITPSKGAKERMLTNIYQKAQKSEVIEPVANQQQKPSFFQKLEAMFQQNRLSLSFCIIAAIALTITIGPKLGLLLPGDMSVGEGYSPYQQLDTLEQLNENLDLTISLPEDLDHQSYSIYDKSIGCIDFIWKDQVYTLMVSKDSLDFNDPSSEKISEEIIDSRYNAILSHTKTNDITNYSLLWTNGETNFYLTSQSESSREWMIEIYQLINF